MDSTWKTESEKKLNLNISWSLTNSMYIYATFAKIPPVANIIFLTLKIFGHDRNHLLQKEKFFFANLTAAIA